MTANEYVPPLNFEVSPDGTWTVTDTTIEDTVRDTLKRLDDAKETALKEAIKGRGWIAPEDIAAHDAEVASEAAEGALRDAADDMPRGWCQEDGPSDSLRDRADRVKAEREAGL